MNQLRDAVGTELVPEFIKLVPVLKEAIPTIKELLQGFVSIAQWAAENPIAASLVGLGALIGKELVTEIASAKIGELIRTMIAGGGGGGVPGVTPASAGAGGFGAVLGGVALQGGLLADMYDKTTGALLTGGKRGEALAGISQNGTPEARAAAAREIAQARAKSGDTETAAAWGDIATRGIGMMVNPVGAAGRWLTDKAIDAAGGTSGSTLASNTLSAGAKVESFDEANAKAAALGEQLAKLATAAKDATRALTDTGAGGGGGGGGAKPQGPGDTLVARNPRPSR